MTIHGIRQEYLAVEENFRLIEQFANRGNDHMAMQSFLESIYNNKKYLEYGCGLIKTGTFTIQKFGTINLHEFDWESLYNFGRSWGFEVHSWIFVSYIIAYHFNTSDDDILDTAKHLIFNWLDKYSNTDETYSFEFIWHDMGMARRVEHILAFITYVHKYAESWEKNNGDLWVMLLDLLYKSGDMLCRDNFYSAHTNHGLYQMQQLLLLSSIVGETQQSNAWKKFALRNISSELNCTFTDEGVHVENSPGYHVFVFKMFLNLLAHYPDEFQNSDFAKLLRRITPKVLEYTSRILRPDRCLPALGDTEQLPTSDNYPVFTDHHAKVAYAWLRYAMTQGVEGRSPEALNKVWPRSGYAVFRNFWQQEGKEYHQACHVIIKAGCLARYHHQQDEGHILLYAFGEDWLIDSGLYNYNEKESLRRHVRSRAAHNVPLITDAPYAKDFKHRLTHWSISSWSEADDAPFVEMDIRVLENVRYVRRVEFHRELMQLTVSDSFFCSDALERNVILLWHVPRDKVIEFHDEATVFIIGKTKALSVKFDSPYSLNFSRASGGKNDKFFSVTSLKFNKIAPSTVIRVSCKISGQASITSRFQYIPKGVIQL